MLSAAAAALLSGPALAAGPTEIKTVVTTPQKTSTTGDLTIDSSGGINIKSATDPALTIDSSNTVISGGAITASGLAAATGISIDTTAASLTGSFTDNGLIDLTGTGNNKTAIHLTGTNSFIGSIVLDSSTVSVVGDTSTGVLTDLGTQMYGDMNLGGTFQMNSATANETTASGNAIVHLLGTLHGNFIVASGAAYSSVGNGAEGIIIGGPIVACDTSVVAGCTETGTFSNSGSINVVGVVTRSTTTTNAESGPALVIGSSIAGGVLNNGPTSGADTTGAAVITGNGTGAASAVVMFSPQDGVTPMTIGVDSSDLINGTFSFINRGNISATPVDPNIGSRAIEIGGNATATVTFAGGFFNSGSIVAQASSISPGSPVSAIGLSVDSYVTLPEIYISAQSAGVSASAGSITAQIAGPEGGSAVAILINGAPVSNGSTTTVVTHVPTITIESGARIAASATVTDPTSTDVSALTAIGIRDVSNSLTTLNNFGTISATTTTLTNGVTAVAHAVDTSLNNVGLTFTNTGTVVGDVLLGSGNDSYTVQGTSSFIASQNGAINFGFSAAGGADSLHVAQFANVAGAITAQGTLDVQVDGTGTLTVENVGTTLATRDFAVAGGTTTTNAGTLNITVSQGAGVPVITASDAATLGTNANLTVTYGSFINTGGSFTLLSAPHGHLNIDPADVARYNAEVGGTGGTLPFLFSSAGIQRVDNVGGQDILQLSVVPKTVGQLGLTGYGAALFSTANIAVATDSALGAAMIAGINSQAQAQSAYDAFAPDVSGGAREIAISLTDQASGVVAARQRALRLFGKQPGDLTLWGNEFGEYISTKGGNVTQDFTGATQALEPGFKDHGFGFSLGLDEGSANNGWYGAAFSFYTGDISEGGDRTSKTSTLWYMLSGYTDWRGKGLFLDTQVTLGYGNFKGKRFLDLTIPITGSTTGTTFEREADSKRAGLMASIGGTLGAIMKYGSTTVIPQLSLDGMSMREEGYTEINGGTGFNLAVKPYYANSLRVFLGSEFREDINLGDFYLQPSARIGYRYDLLNDPVKLHAAFADINTNLSGDQNGAPFTIVGPDPSRGDYVAGFNMAATTENWTIGLNYDFVRGSHNATEQVGTLTLLGRI